MLSEVALFSRYVFLFFSLFLFLSVLLLCECSNAVLVYHHAQGIVSNNPKRVDLWSVYIDMEIKTGNVNGVRCAFFVLLFFPRVVFRCTQVYFSLFLPLSLSLLLISHPLATAVYSSESFT